MGENKTFKLDFPNIFRNVAKMKNKKYEKLFMPGGWLCFVARVAKTLHAKLTMESREKFNKMTKIISILT